MNDLFTVSTDGRDYLCGLCGKVIPEGCQISGKWDSDGTLKGVLVVDGDGVTRHKCGQKVKPEDGGHDGRS